MMRVKVWVETEADAEVTVDDFTSELNKLPDGERLAAVVSAINAAYGVLKRIAGERIAEMTGEQRNLIGSALRDQAARYSPPQA